MAGTPPDSLRHAMYVREGVGETDRQIARGLSAWAIERRDPTYAGGLSRPQTTIVFGKCRSDALRRAKAPARLGESFYGTTWDAMQIRTEWDGPVIWPFERSEAS